MLPPSHLAIGYLLQAKSKPQAIIYSIIGAVGPDFFGVFVYAWLYARRLWGWDQGLNYAYYAENLYGGMFHSALFWLALTLLLMFVPKIKPLVIGGWSHVLLDFLTHRNPYSWNHFYPLNIPSFNGLIYYRNWDFFWLIDVPLYLITLVVIIYQSKPKNWLIWSKIRRWPA